MSEKLRITGGSRRGRRLLSPPRDSIRPASDMIRQAVFNMLAAHVPDCVFYDVFAGTGIVGLEALSRGAGRAIFIERDRFMVSLIRRNLGRASFGPEAELRSADAFVWAQHFLGEEEPTIVFLGPPYPIVERDLGRMLQMIATIQGKLKPNDLLVAQLPRSVHLDQLPDGDSENWYRWRHYGKTQIGIWCHLPPEPVREELPNEADDVTTAGE